MLNFEHLSMNQKVKGQLVNIQRKTYTFAVQFGKQAVRSLNHLITSKHKQRNTLNNNFIPVRIPLRQDKGYEYMYLTQGNATIKSN